MPSAEMKSMTEKAFAPFSRVSSEYRVFRPSYPSPLLVWLASVTPGRRRAWDCGTGTGQAARGLAEHFECVVASDASRGQLAQLPVAGQVLRCCCTAESAAIADGSVDLVTVAQALHWFNADRFFREACRVLVPGGVLAVWTYGSVTADCEPITDLLREFEHETIGPWWPPGRVLVNQGYSGLVLPGVELDVPTFSMRVEWTLEQLFGYLGTWSAVLRHREATGLDPLPPLRRTLVESWGEEDRRRVVSWPLTVRASRVGLGPGSETFEV